MRIRTPNNRASIRCDGVAKLHAVAAPGRGGRGLVTAGRRVFRAALGPSGLRAVKREGDGGSPRGTFTLRQVLWRADRGPRPTAHLPASPIRRHDGWCDAPCDRNYNRPVRLPYPASAERMWREDPLYDIVVVLGANDMPRKRGGGSAIFMHIARPSYKPTEGCVALSLSDLRLVLRAVRRGARLQFG